jgi:hypothetical protein
MAEALSDKERAFLDAYWRAANYLSVGQIYLYDNPLLSTRNTSAGMATTCPRSRAGSGGRSRYPEASAPRRPTTPERRGAGLSVFAISANPTGCKSSTFHGGRVLRSGAILPRARVRGSVPGTAWFHDVGDIFSRCVATCGWHVLDDRTVSSATRARRNFPWLQGLGQMGTRFGECRR